MLRINETVPDFSTKAYHGGKFVDVKLSDFKGRWVAVVFYPADFTFVCPTELEDLQNHYAEFQKIGAEILSVSKDTEFVHKAWHDNSPAIGKITYPMLADPTGKLCKLFGTYIDEDGLSLRGTFLIDPTGKLKTIEIHDNSIGRSAKELLRKIQAAKFVSENDGQVCPASWEPGKDTLTPGEDLVGKI